MERTLKIASIDLNCCKAETEDTKLFLKLGWAPVSAGFTEAPNGMSIVSLLWFPSNGEVKFPEGFSLSERAEESEQTIIKTITGELFGYYRESSEEIPE